MAPTFPSSYCDSLLGKDEVDHVDKHPVLQGLTSVLDDGDDICAAGGHVDQVTARTVRELNGVDSSGGSNDVGDVRDGGSRGGTEVQGLGAGLDVDGLETTQDTGSQLRSERVPDTVFGLGRGTVLALGILNRDTLLVVDGLAGGKVGRCQQIFLAAADDKDTLVSVGLLNTGWVSIKSEMRKLSRSFLGSLRTTIIFFPPLGPPAAPPRPPRPPPRGAPRPPRPPRPRSPPPPRPPSTE